ncbi:hypothetical protein Pcinc_010810 [Petrolisthes cinctipes]|uniref:Uncharacterized protein n=1 Tax=Petrolisthes cinctipes TaxID=88211 RepID=A0AAE1G2D9_PETCI|nr:hypothetical protein Pcinc_010810 [Petrolisthes cinctipes]
MAEGTPVPANNKRKRTAVFQDCKMQVILLEGEHLHESLHRQTVAFRASIFMEMILESLLLSGEDDDRWQDFSKDTVYDTLVDWQKND